MSRCLISLGGNQGPVAEHFAAALSKLDLDRSNRVIAVSSNFATQPVGENAGARFLNAAAELETTLEPLALLDRLQSIEADLGRRRTVHWGPRPIDLDLLFFGDRILETDRLTLPHPAAWYRRFVLDPLLEIAPEFVHPIKRESVLTLHQQMCLRPFVVGLAGGNVEIREQATRRMRTDFPEVVVVDWSGTSHRELVPALIFWLGSAAAGESLPEAAGASFEQLPLLPRIDARRPDLSPIDFISLTVQAALGK